MLRIFNPVIFVLVFAYPSIVHAEVEAIPTQLTLQEQQIVEWVKAHQQAMLDDLQTYVNINSGTFNHEGLNTFRDLLENVYDELGFDTVLQPGGEIKVLSCHDTTMGFADHLLAQRTGNLTTRILLNGHLDTVFPKDDEFQTMTTEPDGTLKGPGVLDMKGGIVALTYALKALHHHGRLQGGNLTVFFNTDEEVGSLDSRRYLEKLAIQHDVGLVFEGSHNHKLVRQRKGLGQARIKVTGRESHAGEAHAEGVSANVELAHKVIALEALTDYEKGTTVNVGIMQGGETRNTRPGCAEAFVDLRYPDNQDGLKLKAQVEHIAQARFTHPPEFPRLPESEGWIVLHRPAKSIHPVTDHLIAQAMGLSMLLGDPLVGTSYSGGGTDGSLMQAKGLPTVDSLGLNGGGEHSSREWTTTQSLIARTKLIAVLLDRLIHQAP